MSYIHFASGGLDFSNVKIDSGEISFKNTVFNTGKKDFQYSDFGTGNKLFTNTEFNDGDVSFINTQFNSGEVSFKIARFGRGRVDFHYARFGQGDKTFERADFGDGDVDFRTVEFGPGRVNFNRSRFGTGNVSFEGCELKNGKFIMKRAEFSEGAVNFELAEMSGTEIAFDRTVFGPGTISFYNGRFGSLSLNSCHLDNYTDLRVAACRSIDLSDTIVRDIIDLMPYGIEQDIGQIRFSGMRLIGRIYIDWIRNRVPMLIANQSDADDRSKAEQFRTLKENFSVCGQYNDEDLAYVRFKRFEARANLHEALSINSLNALWAYPAYLFKLLVFDKVGHYATNPGRVIISMLTGYTFFSFLYVILILTGAGEIIESVNHDAGLNAFGRGFYHSAITFLTIGYGDYYPSGAIRWVSGVEGFTGVFLMSYFTVAFVRKILR